MIRWGYPVKDARKAPTGMLIFRSVFLWCIMGRIKDLLVWGMWAGGAAIEGLDVACGLFLKICKIIMIFHYFYYVC